MYNRYYDEQYTKIIGRAERTAYRAAYMAGDKKAMDAIIADQTTPAAAHHGEVLEQQTYPTTKHKQTNQRNWKMTNLFNPVRFYHYNSEDKPVLVTLGDELDQVTMTDGGLNDEGYSYITITFSIVGANVVRHREQNACDCDGRLDREWTDCCPIAEIVCSEEETPHWKKICARQRDYAAEAMGY